MKLDKRRSTVLLALLMALFLALAAFSSLAGYYIDANGNHIYISDSSVVNGQYYLDGNYYIAYTGSLNYNYYNSAYYYGYSPVTFAYTQLTMDSLGGVTAPRSTMIEARVNNRYLGLSVVGMREDLMDLEALAFGVSATRLTFDQSLGRAADKSLTLIMRSSQSSVSDNDQYALGILGCYNDFIKAADEGLGSLTLIDRSENFRVTIGLESFISALKKPLADAGANFNKDDIQVQVRPMDPPSTGSMTASSNAYKISVFLYKYDDDQSSLVDLSSSVEHIHTMLKLTTSTRSALVIAREDRLETAESPRWIQQSTGTMFASGYVPAGETFTAVATTK